MRIIHTLSGISAVLALMSGVVSAHGPNVFTKEVSRLRLKKQITKEALLGCVESDGGNYRLVLANFNTMPHLKLSYPQTNYTVTDPKKDRCAPIKAAFANLKSPFDAVTLEFDRKLMHSLQFGDGGDCRVYDFYEETLVGFPGSWTYPLQEESLGFVDIQGHDEHDEEKMIAECQKLYDAAQKR
jgi:hypothetical protein